MTERFQNRGDRPGKTGFGEGIRDAGIRNPAVVAIGADITASVGLNLFADRFPERFFSMGIAEQNAVAVAAGFALEGRIPVFSTYGVFAALRAADQIRVSVCYNNLRVVIGGAHAGVSVGPDGATHQALEDIAVMRALPNMTLFSPCDVTQARLAALSACLHSDGPVYIRYGREAVPDFTSPETDFEPGKAQVLHEGSDITVVATGHLVWEALQAAYALEEQGIQVRVINIHTIKPIDGETLVRAARDTGRIITAEEHQVAGGLGSAVAEVIVRHQPVPMRMIGMPDRFGESGTPEELMKRFGLCAENIIREIHDLIS